MSNFDWKKLKGKGLTDDGLIIPNSVLGTGGTGPDLSDVYRLQLAGQVGPRTTPLKPVMTDASTLHPDLSAQGCALQTNGGTYVWIPPTGVEIEGFDHTLGAFGESTREWITFGSSGVGPVFRDNKMRQTDTAANRLTIGATSGNNYQPSNIVGARFEYCDMGPFLLICKYGSGEVFRSKLANARNSYAVTAGDGNGAVEPSLLWDHNWVQGGGFIGSDAGTHIEWMKHDSKGLFRAVDTLLDVTNIIAAPPYVAGSGFTGLVYMSPASGWEDQSSEFERIVIMGVEAHNLVWSDNNTISNSLSYNARSAANMSVKDSVLGLGTLGYCFNHSGGALRPTDLGGNRGFASNLPVDVSV